MAGFWSKRSIYPAWQSCKAAVEVSWCWRWWKCCCGRFRSTYESSWLCVWCGWDLRGIRCALKSLSCRGANCVPSHRSLTEQALRPPRSSADRVDLSHAHHREVQISNLWTGLHYLLTSSASSQQVIQSAFGFWQRRPKDIFGQFDCLQMPCDCLVCGPCWLLLCWSSRVSARWHGLAAGSFFWGLVLRRPYLTHALLGVSTKSPSGFFAMACQPPRWPHVVLEVIATWGLRESLQKLVRFTIMGLQSFWQAILRGLWSRKVLRRKEELKSRALRVQSSMTFCHSQVGRFWKNGSGPEGHTSTFLRADLWLPSWSISAFLEVIADSAPFLTQGLPRGPMLRAGHRLLLSGPHSFEAVPMQLQETSTLLMVLLRPGSTQQMLPRGTALYQKPPQLQSLTISPLRRSPVFTHFSSQER